MRSSTSHRQRIENCLAGTSRQDVPVALWRHFPVDDQGAATLAKAHLFFQKTFDFDLLKVTPASSYMAKDWGTVDEWRGTTEGTRTYTHQVINTPDDWTKLSILHPSQGSLGMTIEALQMITDELGPQTPVIQTVFSPLSQAKNLIGREKLIVHLRQYPDALHEGLKIIAESTRRYVEAIKKTGIAGVFYAVQHAQYGLLSVQEYVEFGRTYDLIVLEALDGLWLNLLHLHGENVTFDQFIDYPVQIINWHDQETPPSLAEGLTAYKGIVCGGLQREQSMVLGTPEQIRHEAQRAYVSTGGERFILGTGCVVPIHAPYGNFLAARQAVDLF